MIILFDECLVSFYDFQSETIFEIFRLDLEKAKSDLDEDHYSMDKLKRRVLEYLAVRQLQSNVTGSEQSVKGPILCFVGPPGVGKTSVGRSIARTLGRKFHRISLGRFLFSPYKQKDSSQNKICLLLC